MLPVALREVGDPRSDVFPAHNKSKASFIRDSLSFRGT